MSEPEGHDSTYSHQVSLSDEDGHSEEEHRHHAHHSKVVEDDGEGDDVDGDGEHLGERGGGGRGEEGRTGGGLDTMCGCEGLV